MSEETPCRYVEAFNEAKSQLEMRLESLLTSNLSELEEKRRALAQLVEREPERVTVKERLEWLLQQEAKLQEALAKGSTCSRCKVLPDAAAKLLGCSNGHLTCRECHPGTSLSLASCSTCGEAVDKRSLLAVTVIGVIRRDCRHAGCLAPYHPTSASSHACVFVRGEKESVTTDAKSGDPLLRAQQRVLELEVIMEQTEKFHQEALGDLNKDLCPLSVKMEEVARVEKELEAVESKLTEGLECPVCWEVATEGVLHCCPNGHLVCESCHQEMTQKTNALCPSCRIPIGSSVSLLATVVQQNIQEASKATESPHASDASALDSKMAGRQASFGQRGGVATSQQQLLISDPNRLVPVQITIPAALQGNPQSQPRALTVQVPAHALQQGGSSSSTLQQVLTQAIPQGLSCYPVEHAAMFVQTQINSAFQL